MIHNSSVFKKDFFLNSNSSIVFSKLIDEDYLMYYDNHEMRIQNINITSSTYAWDIDSIIDDYNL